MRIKASKAFQQIQASRRDDLENFSIRMADLFDSVNGKVIEDIIAKGSDKDVEDAYRFMNSIYRQLTFLEDLHTEIFGSQASSQNQNIKAARARAGVSRGTPEQMMTALNNKIVELGGEAVVSSTQVTAGTGARGAEIAYADALGKALNGEVEDFGVRVTDSGVSLNITYMGNSRSYTFSANELSPDMSDVAGDAAYMANIVFQDLDTMGSFVEGSTNVAQGRRTQVQAAQGQDAAMDSLIRNMFEQCWDNTGDEEMSRDDFIQTVKEHVQTGIEESLLDADPDMAMSYTEMLCNQWIDAGEGPTFTDVQGDRMEAAFADAIEAEIGNEVESLAVVAKEDALVVTITYMGQVHEYNVPFADIHPDLSDMDGDVAYIVNTIRQDLDNIDNNV